MGLDIEFKQDKMAQLIMNEYEDVMETMSIEPYYLYIPYSYVPNIFDVIGVFDEVNYKVMYKTVLTLNHYQLFFKFDGDYFNVPFKEAW